MSLDQRGKPQSMHVACCVTHVCAMPVCCTWARLNLCFACCVCADSSSEHSGVLPSLLPEVVDAIRANAELVISTGETLKPGAWKGCSKSAECDREDRHRGLCNHRATIPGPMAVAYASQQLPVDSLTDSFTEQQDEGMQGCVEV